MPLRTIHPKPRRGTRGPFLPNGFLVSWAGILIVATEERGSRQSVENTSSELIVNTVYGRLLDLLKAAIYSTLPAFGRRKKECNIVALSLNTAKELDFTSRLLTGGH
jgi:hypothetical protein